MPRAVRMDVAVPHKVELSHRIVIFEIAPNERIVERFRAGKLQVNRAAIRESLTRLLGEGLVCQGIRGGFFVTEMSKEEIVQLREVREILETGAFSLACERATAGQIQEIDDTVNDLASFAQKGYFTGAPRTPWGEPGPRVTLGTCEEATCRQESAACVPCADRA